MKQCEHEYGVSGGTIYCIHCPSEWDLAEIMATNPPKRRPSAGVTAGEAKPACSCTHAPEQHDADGCQVMSMFGKLCDCGWSRARP